MLWQAIRRGALGVRFRRQVVLGPYIADFFAPDAKLVVEVDGAVHRARCDSDRLRDAWMVTHGLRVVRIDASLVERDLPEAVARVRRALCASP
jgi:very-short-patch-repair endonuclease